MNRIVDEINRLCYFNGNLYQCIWKPYHFSDKNHRGYCYYKSGSVFRLCDSCKKHADSLMLKLHNQDLILLALTIQEREISDLKARVKKTDKKSGKNNKIKPEIQAIFIKDQEPMINKPIYTPEIESEYINQEYNDEKTPLLIPHNNLIKNEFEMYTME